MLKKCGSCLLPLKAWRATTPGKQKKKRLFTAPLHTAKRRKRGWLDSYLWILIRSIHRNRLIRLFLHRKWNVMGYGNTVRDL